jgi:hypothetical protein
MQGRIKQFDQYNDQYKTDLNTTTLTIAGTTISASTDEAGNYTLSNVPVGTHTLTLSRPGSRLINLPQTHMFANGNLQVNISISDTANFRFLSGSVKDSITFARPGFIARVSVTADSKMRYALVLISKTQNINPQDAATFQHARIIFMDPDKTDYRLDVPYEVTGLDDHFEPGQQLYARLYPTAGAANTTYNYAEDRENFNGCGTPLPFTYTLTMP